MTGELDLSGKSILVVEDEYFMATDMEYALRAAGATVLGLCPTEESARRLLSIKKPSAVVLDLKLGGSGPSFEIAHLLRERGIPFVFLTGYDRQVIPEDLASIAFFQKPVPLEDVVEAVSRLP